MSEKTGIFVMASICVLVLFILVLKQRAQFALNFLVRLVMGTIVILFLNDLLEKQGLPLNVGLNAITLLTTGSLGFPGVALLYGIEATKFL